jgi:tripartite-type tricarboxylate transporter receptor subunit TctC
MDARLNEKGSGSGRRIPPRRTPRGQVHVSPGSLRPVVLAAFAGMLLLPTTVQAQTWPSRPVAMVVPFAAGGPMDTVARILAPGMSERLGQQVIVENVGGGGGTIGSTRVAKAPPDGYQFVLGNVGTHAVSQTLSKTPPYNSLTDFTPVALIADLSLVLVARKDLPAGNLPDFIAHAKAHQAKMQFGSAGAGSATHLGCVLLNAAIGINVTHVPYRGGAPAMQDLISGRIDYLCIDTPIVIPQLESGNLKAVAILTRGRSSSLPTLASAHEQGLTDFEASNWSAFFLPKGPPAPITEKLNNAIVAAASTPSVQQRLKDNGVDVVAPDRRSPDYLAKFVASEIAKWAGPVKAAGVTSD